MLHIIDPETPVPIILECDRDNPKPTIFWGKLLGPKEAARLTGITQTRLNAAVAGGAKQADPETQDKIKDSEIAFLAGRIVRIQNWPGIAADISDSGSIAAGLASLTVADYVELYRKFEGTLDLTDYEGKASASLS